MNGTRSQLERLWLAGGVLVVAVVALLAWFVVVNPKLSESHEAETRTADAQTANLALNARVQKLRAQTDALSTIQDALRSVREALPTSADVDVFTRQLSADATRAGVTVTSITAANPVPVVGTGKPTAGNGIAAQNIAGQLFSIHISVVTDGPAAGQQQFLHAVQDGARAALVTAVSVAPSSTSQASQAHSRTGRSTMTVEMDVFVAPQSPEAEEALQKQLSAGGG
jgi:hypothetical protein